MLLSDSLLYFFLPDLKKSNLVNLEAYFNSIQLEIVESWEPRVKSPHPAKVLSMSLADEERYRYELCSLRTGNIFYIYSHLDELDINKVIFINKTSIADNSVIEDKELLTFLDIFEERKFSDNTPKLTPLVLDSGDVGFEELLKFNFFFPNKFYRLKQIYKYCDFSTIWAISQELSLPANVIPRKFDNSKSEKLFPNNSTGNLLISIFLKSLQLKGETNYQKRIELLKTHLFGTYVDFIFSAPEKKLTKSSISSQINLKKLLPIFSDLKESWEEKVIKRLSLVFFSFKSSGDENEWKIFWPPWYYKNNLPEISELLVKLIPLNNSPKLLSKQNSNDISLREFNSKNLASETRKVIKIISEIKSYWENKGFVECNTVKFIEWSKNFKLPEKVLTSNTEISLRDHLHISLSKVLIENLNLSNQLYPIFELSFCPWKNSWKLALATVTNFAMTKKERIWNLNLSLLKKLVIDCWAQFFKKSIQFQEIPNDKRYISDWRAAKLYDLIYIQNNEEVKLGELLVFREEQLEFRKQELISINLDILT